MVADSDDLKDNLVRWGCQIYVQTASTSFAGGCASLSKKIS